MTTSQNLLIRQPLLVQNANLATQLFSNPSHLLLQDWHLTPCHRPEIKAKTLFAPFQKPLSSILRLGKLISNSTHKHFPAKNCSQPAKPFVPKSLSQFCQIFTFSFPPGRAATFRTGGFLCDVCHFLLPPTLFNSSSKHTFPVESLTPLSLRCNIQIIFLLPLELLSLASFTAQHKTHSKHTERVIHFPAKRWDVTVTSGGCCPSAVMMTLYPWQAPLGQVQTSGNITTSLLVTTIPEGALWSPLGLSYSRCCAQLLLCLMPIIIGFTRTQLNTAARTPFDVTLANSSSLYSYASVFPPCSRTRLSSAVTNQLNSEHTLCAS